MYLVIVVCICEQTKKNRMYLKKIFKYLQYKYSPFTRGICSQLTQLQLVRKWSRTRSERSGRWPRCSQSSGDLRVHHQYLCVLQKYSVLHPRFFFCYFLQRGEWERVDAEGPDPHWHAAQRGSLWGQTDAAERWVRVWTSPTLTTTVCWYGCNHGYWVQVCTHWSSYLNRPIRMFHSVYDLY